MASILENKLSNSGYNMLVSSYGKRGEHFQKAINFTKSRCVEAYIIAGNHFVKEELKVVVSLGKPVVLFDQYFESVNSHYVLSDQFNGAYDAVSHLRDQGYLRIGFIAEDYTSHQSLDRLNGYCKAVEDYNMKATVLRLECDELDQATVSLSNFLFANNNLDALVFGSSTLMKMGLQIAAKNKWDVFSSKGIISFDDIDILRYLTPSITVISQPVEKIGHLIVRTLDRALTHGHNKEKSFSRVKIATELMIRESTKLIIP